jgi:hypothetical protein
MNGTARAKPSPQRVLSFNSVWLISPSWQLGLYGRLLIGSPPWSPVMPCLPRPVARRRPHPAPQSKGSLQDRKSARIPRSSPLRARQCPFASHWSSPRPPHTPAGRSVSRQIRGSSSSHGAAPIAASQRKAISGCSANRDLFRPTALQQARFVERRRATASGGNAGIRPFGRSGKSRERHGMPQPGSLAIRRPCQGSPGLPADQRRAAFLTSGWFSR